jgi:hypothetical protein
MISMTAQPRTAMSGHEDTKARNVSLLVLRVFVPSWLILMALPLNALAQSAERAQLKVLFADSVEDVKGATSGEQAVAFATAVDRINFIVAYSLPETRAEFLRLLENQRIGKQVGAAVLPSGTTSLVAKGDTPSVLGFALEHGLVTGTKTGNTITLRGNLMGLIEGAVRGIGMPPSAGIEARLLRRLSFSGSFEPTNAQATADSQIDEADRLSAWTARFDVINRRHAQDRFNRIAWAALISTGGQALADATSQADTALSRDPAFTAWRTATDTAMRAATADGREAVFLDRLVAFRALDLAPATRAAFDRALAAYKVYLKQRQGVLDGIAKAGVVSLEYTNSRPSGGPRTSNVRLIADGPFIGGSITGNLSVSLFDGDKPPNADTIRDIQGAFQYDFRLRPASEMGPPVLVSIAVRGQWLAEDVMLRDALFPDTKGTVITGQLKVTVPVGDSPIRVPISITYSNRSELVKEKFVRGQVGLTFDVDSLLAGAGLRR